MHIRHFLRVTPWGDYSFFRRWVQSVPSPKTISNITTALSLSLFWIKIIKLSTSSNTSWNHASCAEKRPCGIRTGVSSSIFPQRLYVDICSCWKFSLIPVRWKSRYYSSPGPKDRYTSSLRRGQRNDLLSWTQMEEPCQITLPSWPCLWSELKIVAEICNALMEFTF